VSRDISIDAVPKLLTKGPKICGSIYSRIKDFSLHQIVHTAPGNQAAPFQLVWEVISHGVKWPGRDAYHSPLSGAGGKSA
jgi:hypothetical protein